MHSRSYDVSVRANELAAEDNCSENSDQTLSRLSWKIKLFFSFGHIYNDLCASFWFSYALIFFQMQFKGTTASFLILLGQVADALATPFVG